MSNPLFQLMVLGQIGSLGQIAQSLVEEEQNTETEPVIHLHLTLEEKIV